MPNTKYPIPCPLTGRMAYEGTASQLQEYFILIGQKTDAGHSEPVRDSGAPSVNPLRPDGSQPDLKIL